MAAVKKADLSTLESEFGQSANVLYEQLLDLNTPVPKLHTMWKNIMDVRGKILSCYGVAPTPTPAAMLVPGGGTTDAMAGAFEGGGGDSNIDYKSKLCQAIAKHQKKSITKGELVYTVEDATEGKGYMASVTSASGLLQQEYASEEPASSKRQAEHMAAKVALRTEFPDAAAMAEAQSWITGGPPNKKRKLGGGMPNNPMEWLAAAAQQMWGGEGGGDILPFNKAAHSNKNKLNHAAQVLMGRPIQKGDVVWEVPEKAEGGQYTASVSIPGHSNAVYTAQSSSSKKDAENKAAEAALEALKDTVEQLEAEIKAKRAEKAKQAREKKKIATQGGSGGEQAKVAPGKVVGGLAKLSTGL